MKTRVSTRDQILEALSESAAGLTLPELAEFCTACDHDEQIVGTMLAILHRENVIHPGPELRGGLKVWIFGKEPIEEHQPPISLASGDKGPRVGQRAPVSEAALAIAGMRQDSPRTRAHAAPSVQSPALTVRAKIEAALREHGPMRATDIEKHVDEKRISSECSTLLYRKILVKLGGNRRGSIYGLPGQTLKDQKDTQPTKGRDPETLIRKANGGEGAVTPAAGPAIAEEPKPAAAPVAHREIHAKLERWGDVRREGEKGGDTLYKAALLDLQDRRDAKVAELAKIDRAIEAMRELA